MNINWVAFELAQSRQEELIAEVARMRRLGRNRTPIRQVIGRRLIAAGRWIAAEPTLELARSR
jgi:hypothetical protein